MNENVNQSGESIQSKKAVGDLLTQRPTSGQLVFYNRA